MGWFNHQPETFISGSKEPLKMGRNDPKKEVGSSSKENHEIMGELLSVTECT